jgi:hypothetical protein
MLGSNLVTEDGDTLPQAFAKRFDEWRKQMEKEEEEAAQAQPDETSDDEKPD